MTGRDVLYMLAALAALLLAMVAPPSSSPPYAQLARTIRSAATKDRTK
jgi:hypothetical protein